MYHSISNELLSTVCNESTLVERQFLQRRGAGENATNALVEILLVDSACHALDVDVATTLQTELSDCTSLSLRLCVRLQQLLLRKVQIVDESRHRRGNVVLDVIVHGLHENE